LPRVRALPKRHCPSARKPAGLDLPEGGPGLRRYRGYAVIRRCRPPAADRRPWPTASARTRFPGSSDAGCGATRRPRRARRLPARRAAAPPASKLQRPVLVIGVGVAVLVQQVHHPVLDIVSVDLLPPGLTRLAEQMGGGEPGHSLGRSAHGPLRLALRCQVQPEGADFRPEHPRIQLRGAPQPPRHRRHSFAHPRERTPGGPSGPRLSRWPEPIVFIWVRLV
jgi:hypothetical protein